VPGYRSGGDIVIGGGYVWITLKGNYPVIQIDPKTNTMIRKFKVFGMGDAIRYGAGSLWVSGGQIFSDQGAELIALMPCSLYPLMAQRRHSRHLL
jgi:hypothetical protein